MGAGVPACAASQHAYLDRHGELIDAILSACRQQAWNRGEGSSSLSGRGRPSCAERPCESSYNHALASTCSLRKFLLLGRTADCAMVAGPAGTPRFANVLSRSHYLPPPPAPIAKVIAGWVHKPWTAAPHLACTQIFGHGHAPAVPHIASSGGHVACSGSALERSACCCTKSALLPEPGVESPPAVAASRRTMSALQRGVSE